MDITTTVPAGAHGSRIWPPFDQELTEADAIEVIGPSVATITVSPEERPDLTPYHVEVYVMLYGGHYRVHEVKASTAIESVTVAGLGSIRVSRIVQEGLRTEVTVRRRTAQGDTVTGVGKDDEAPLVYALARATGNDPTKAVAEHFGIARTAAAQRVARARKAGLIPPTTQGAR